MFLKMWRSPNTQTGQLLCVLLSWCQYCVGTGTPILQKVSAHLPHSESKWIYLLCQYLSSLQAHIELHDASIPPLRCHHDAFLMDMVCNSICFPPVGISKTNYCCMFLNVLLLSDIVMPCGTCINPAAYDGQGALYWINTNNQVHCPSSKSWETFMESVEAVLKYAMQSQT